MPQNLPVAIGNDIGGVKYDIIIGDMNFTPQGAKVTAYFIVKENNSGKEIMFAGDDIIMHPTGFSAGGKLVLVKDFDVEFDPVGKMILKSDGETYVEFDCNGYKETKLDGLFEFSRKMVEPAEGSNTDEKVKGFFTTSLYDWNDFTAEISITPFKVKALNDFRFTVNNAIFDFSDYSNPDGVKFPNSYGGDETDALWRGFYLGELIVEVPRQVKKADKKPVTFTATDLLIDDKGVSGLFAAKNLIAMNQGNMEKWQFSVDYLGAEFERSQFKMCSFNGQIKLPVQDGKDPFGLNYGGSITSNGFMISSNIIKDITIEAPVFSSELTIRSDSKLEIEYKNNKLLPRANLNGKLSVKRDDPNVEIAEIKFEGLKLQTAKT